MHVLFLAKKYKTRSHLHMEDRDGGSINLPWPLTSFREKDMQTRNTTAVLHIPLELFISIVILFVLVWRPRLMKRAF